MNVKTRSGVFLLTVLLGLAEMQTINRAVTRIVHYNRQDMPYLISFWPWPSVPRVMPARPQHEKQRSGIINQQDSEESANGREDYFGQPQNSQQVMFDRQSQLGQPQNSQQQPMFDRQSQLGQPQNSQQQPMFDRQSQLGQPQNSKQQPMFDRQSQLGQPQNSQQQPMFDRQSQLGQPQNSKQQPMFDRQSQLGQPQNSQQVMFDRQSQLGQPQNSQQQPMFDRQSQLGQPQNSQQQPMFDRQSQLGQPQDSQQQPMFDHQSQHGQPQDSQHAGTFVTATNTGQGASGMGGSSSLAGFSGQENRHHLCAKEPSPGECRGAFPRFFYNSETNQCDCFVYGGCEPDDGQPQLVFKNLEECQHTCKPSNLQKGPTCDIVFRKEESFRLFTSAATTTSRPRPNLDLSHFNDDSLLGLFANI